MHIQRDYRSLRQATSLILIVALLTCSGITDLDLSCTNWANNAPALASIGSVDIPVDMTYFEPFSAVVGGECDLEGELSFTPVDLGFEAAWTTAPDVPVASCYPGTNANGQSFELH